ncbi:MAG: TlpA family protein disulfide reductase [Deltaproteobacteria bacterium]|nr:TlpA family protein disulfide reductase [Deltaproteobacteria bacterium]
MEAQNTEPSTATENGGSIRRLIITLLIIGPVLALLAYGFTRDARYITSPLMAKPAVPFTITLFDGKKLSLDDLKGKTVFLNFWASWCPPCRAEARDLEAAWQKVKDQNMVFIGVALQDTDEASREFLKEFDVTYPNGKDESGKIAVEYGTWGIPESFFIDPQGRITYKHVGGIRASVVVAKINEAAKGIVSAQEGKGDYQPVR